MTTKLVWDKALYMALSSVKQDALLTLLLGEATSCEFPKREHGAHGEISVYAATNTRLSGAK